MCNKLISLVASVALIALTSTAYANEPAPAKQTLAQSNSPKQPMALSDKQMDKVTAGDARGPGGGILRELENSTVQTPTGGVSVTLVTKAMAISMGLVGN